MKSPTYILWIRNEGRPGGRWWDVKVGTAEELCESRFLQNFWRRCLNYTGKCYMVNGDVMEMYMVRNWEDLLRRLCQRFDWAWVERVRRT